MSKLFRTLGDYLRKYYFLILAVLALVLPDIQLKGLVQPVIFTKGFVLTATKIFTASWVFIIVYSCAFLLPKRTGRITYTIISLFYIIISFSQYIYFKIFDQFFWLESILIAGEGADYVGYATQYIDDKLLTYTCLSVLSLIIAIIGWRKPEVKSRKKALVLILPLIAIIVTHFCMLSGLNDKSSNEWDMWRKPNVVYSNFTDVNKSYEATGLYQFTFRNITKKVFPSGKKNESELAKVDEYFAQKGELRKNSYTGLFEGKNVIAVMMESIDTWMIDKKYTPTIYKMMNEGINFTNYNAPFFGSGFTFNSEFAFNTGFYTPASAVSASTFSGKNFPYSLAHLFREAGYTANSFHFNDAEFYNRGIMHKTLGYERYNCFTKLGLSSLDAQLDSNILRSDEIYSKVIEKKPFYDFFITYSAHLPYSGDDAKLKIAKEYRPDLIEENMSEEKNNALILAADTDEFFRQLLEKLEQDGLLEDTVIVAFTDHFVYGISDQEALLNEWKKGKLSYCVPAFIYSKGLKAKEISKPMMTVDWVPTLVNLFNLNRDGKYIGGDVLDSENEGFVYFETYSWIDGNTHYDTSNPIEPKTAEDKIYIQKQNERVAKMIEVNDIAVSADYFGERKTENE